MSIFLKKKLLIASLTAGTALFASAGAQAQIEEIIVTAQKRSESVQNVSATISAFDADTLREARFDDINDVAGMLPNVDVKSAVAGTNPVITIRGVGLNDFSSNNTGSVGVYVDEVFLATLAALDTGFFDIERLEVLKGPQGTLYGRNSTGGALNIITQKPTDEFEGVFGASVSDYNTTDVSFVLNMPLGSNWASRISYSSSKQGESFDTNQITGDDYGDSKSFGVRGQLSYIGGENFDLNLKVEAREVDAAAVPYKAIGLMDKDVTDIVLGFDPVFGPILATDPLVGLGGFGEFCTAASTACSDINGFVDGSSDPHMTSSNFGDRDRTDVDALATTLTMHLETDFGTWTSVSGHMKLDRQYGEDIDGSPSSLLEYNQDQELEQFSQELRLNKSMDSADMVFGLFYSKDEMSSENDVNAERAFFTRLSIDYEQETTSYAAFGNVDWLVNDQVTVMTGLRLTHEEKTYVGGTTDNNPFGCSVLLYDVIIPGCWAGPDVPFSFTNVTLEEDDVSGRIGIEYHPSDAVMYYATYNRGFKSGGVIGDITFDTSELDPFESETVHAYEAGVKADLSTSFRVNGAFFKYDYKNIQTFVEGSLGPVMGNAESADVYGADVDVLWYLTDSFSIQSGLGWLESEIQDASAALDGNELPNAPGLSFFAQARHERQISDSLMLITQAQVKYSDQMYRDAENTESTRSPSHSIVDARIAIQSIDSGWELALWSKNLFDEDFAQTAYNLPTIGVQIEGYTAPRTYGVSFNTSF